jgi:hypothetical protein
MPSPQPDLIPPPKVTQYGPELPPPATGKRHNQTDPTLLMAAKVDRLLAGLEPQMRAWVIEWIRAKYERTP